MQLKIFDVSHGFCALLTADNGCNVLLDCGCDDDFRPSAYLPAVGIRSIQNLIVSHADSDHVRDLPSLLQSVSIESLTRNTSMTTSELRDAKLHEGPLRAGVLSMLAMNDEYTHDVDPPIDYCGVELTYFRNEYPTFTDLNNLSLVTFVEFDGLSIVFPGDLETEGWEMLLEAEGFREYLARVDIFVASHHGRQNGYCEGAFDFCSPMFAVISDKGIEHDSQINCYANHVRGLPWTNTDGSKTTRYVLTTRCDGHITIKKTQGEPFFVTCSR
jgi:beta-lactamase superfamily II metal-dependent hydrolase